MKPIQSYDDIFRPRAFILINDVIQQDMMDRMTRFVFDDSDNKMDKVEITLVNENFMFTDDTRFLEGLYFSCYWGYPNNWTPVRRFRFMKAKPSFPENGQSMVQLVGYDLREGMNKTSAPKNWGAVSSSTIATAIAKKYKLTPVVEASSDARKQSRTQAANTTDIQYLMSLAAKINFECYVTGTELHFHPIRMSGPPEIEYTYFTDNTSGMLSFQPEVNQNVPTGQGVAGVDPKTGQSATHTDTKGNEPLLGRGIDSVRGQYTQGLDLAQHKAAIEARKRLATRTGKAVPPSATSGVEQVGQNADGSPIWGTASPLTFASPETNKRVIAGQAQAVKQKGRKKKAESTLMVIGNPLLKAKILIYIRGVGTTFSGMWRVSGTTHTIDATKYTCSVKVEKNGIGATTGAGAADAGAVKNKNDTAGAKGTALRQIKSVVGQYGGTYSAPIGAKKKTTTGGPTQIGQNADGSPIFG